MTVPLPLPWSSLARCDNGKQCPPRSSHACNRPETLKLSNDPQHKISRPSDPAKVHQGSASLNSAFAKEAQVRTARTCSPQVSAMHPSGVPALACLQSTHAPCHTLRAGAAEHPYRRPSHSPGWWGHQRPRHPRACA